MRPSGAGAGLVALVVLVALAAGGCARHDSWPASTGDRVRVVAAFYPLAELARRVGGDDVAVVDLTPPGGEPHDVEITSSEVDRIEDADIAVEIGGGFQPAVEEATRRAGLPRVDLLEKIPPARRLRATEGRSSTTTPDPHFWLDPTLYADAADQVASAFSTLRPDAAPRFAARAAAYRTSLAALDTAYTDRLRRCDRRVLVTSHAAFAYLASRYGLTQAAVTGISPDAEPEPDRLDELSRLVAAEGVTTVFTEPGTSRRVADTLARETGARVDTLSPLETLTAAQRAAGDDYVAVMRSNLDRLASALGCTP